MTTYVLVHGAWGGAHTFHSSARCSAPHGHEVFTPSLTGHRRAGPPRQPAGRPVDARHRRRQLRALRGPARHRPARLLLRRDGGVRGARAHRRPGPPPRLPRRVRPGRRRHRRLDERRRRPPPFPLVGIGRDWLIPRRHASSTNRPRRRSWTAAGSAPGRVLRRAGARCRRRSTRSRSPARTSGPPREVPDAPGTAVFDRCAAHADGVAGVDPARHRHEPPHPRATDRGRWPTSCSTLA